MQKSYTITVDDAVVAKMLIELSELADDESDVWEDTLGVITFALSCLGSYGNGHWLVTEEEALRFIENLRSEASRLEDSINDDRGEA